MFVYQCPRCGWMIQVQELFKTPKPCLNCEGTVVLKPDIVKPGKTPAPEMARVKEVK